MTNKIKVNEKSIEQKKEILEDSDSLLYAVEDLGKLKYQYVIQIWNTML